MKKIILFTIFLLCFYTSTKAQYERLSFVVERFQSKLSYDSVIIYGEEILSTNKFDESRSSKSFYSYFLHKLSLAYNEFNLLEKSENLYSKFSNEINLIDIKNENIIYFLSNICEVYLVFGNTYKADSILNISSNLINLYHSGNIDVESIYLRDYIKINAEKNNLNYADSVLLKLKNKLNSKENASNYILANVALANKYQNNNQNYNKVESLLTEATIIDSTFKCDLVDLITDNLLDLYTNSYQIDKFKPFIDRKLNEINNRKKNGEFDILDIISISKYILLLSDLKNFDERNKLIIDLYERLKIDLPLISIKYVSQIARTLSSAAIGLENIDTGLSLEANNLAIKEISDYPYYIDGKEDIYLNVSRFYSKLYFDSNNSQKNYLDSISYYLSIALDITKKQFGLNSKEHVKSLQGLYNYYFWKEDYTSALKLSKYFIEIPCQNGTLSTGNCTDILLNIYFGYKELKDSVNAIIYLNQWNNQWKDYISKNAAFLLPNYQYNNELGSKIESYNGEVLRQGYKELYPSVFENLLIYKYYQLSSKIETKKSGKDFIDSLSNINFQAIKKVNINRQNLEKLLNLSNYNKVEKSINDILKNLSKDEVCIEIFKCKYPSNSIKKTFTDQYYALVGFGDSKKLESAYLGDEIDFNNKFKIIYNTYLHGKDYEILYGNSIDGLSSFLLKPLLPIISNYKTLFISTYGFLSNVNFSILALNENEILEDKFTIHQLFSSSEISKVKNKPSFLSKELNINLFGGIYFDSSELINSSKKSINDSYKSRSGKDTWTYLPETENEINSIFKLFSKKGFVINKLTGINANEGKFYTLSNNKFPKIFHFATHGFSIDNKVTTNKNESIYLNDQLDLSGIILAGANKYWSINKIGLSNYNDGILTSKEISTLDLSDCKLITLSACETGLGAQLSNDGIFGLQRGLKLAGVDNSITSLWSVPDKSTKELFEYFYANIIEGNDLQNSLRLARKELRKKYKSPYFWGAFTLME